MDRETILILDFGGHHNHLVARKVRELNVYCEVLPYNVTVDDIREKNPKGIILTGGPKSIKIKMHPNVIGKYLRWVFLSLELAMAVSLCAIIWGENS